MQINMPESGTFLFISDHCHVIENVCSTSSALHCIAHSDVRSGGMGFRRVGWLAIIRLGSVARCDSSKLRGRPEAISFLATTKKRFWHYRNSSSRTEASSCESTSRYVPPPHFSPEQANAMRRKTIFHYSRVGHHTLLLQFLSRQPCGQCCFTPAS